MNVFDPQRFGSDPTKVTSPNAASTLPKCLACSCVLKAEEGDDIAAGVCSFCVNRREARHLLAVQENVRATAESGLVAPRSFTDAEKAMIKKMHGYLPAVQLLALLNERLTGDLGSSALLYTMEQLREQIGQLAEPQTDATDWASLRKLLARASRDGILAMVDEQLINDFAVVFSLNARQALQLKDIVLNARKGTR